MMKTTMMIMMKTTMKITTDDRTNSNHDYTPPISVPIEYNAALDPEIQETIHDIVADLLLEHKSQGGTIQDYPFPNLVPNIIDECTAMLIDIVESAVVRYLCQLIISPPEYIAEGVFVFCERWWRRQPKKEWVVLLSIII